MDTRKWMLQNEGYKMNTKNGHYKMNRTKSLQRNKHYKNDATKWTLQYGH